MPLPYDKNHCELRKRGQTAVLRFSLSLCNLVPFTPQRTFTYKSAQTQAGKRSEMMWDSHIKISCDLLCCCHLRLRYGYGAYTIEYCRCIHARRQVGAVTCLRSQPPGAGGLRDREELPVGPVWLIPDPKNILKF